MADLLPKTASFNPVPVQTQTRPPVESESNGNVAKITQPNMFKLQRGRSEFFIIWTRFLVFFFLDLKKSYVDVFNPNGNQAVTPQSSGAGVAQMNFFVPQPMNDPNAPTDFLTPAPPLQFDDNGQVC